MKVEYVVLADGAHAVGGKLYILGGGWSVFRAQAFPSGIQVGLGILVSYTSNEFGQSFGWSIAISDEAGVSIVPDLSAQSQIPPASADLPAGVTQHRLPFAMQLGLPIPRPGKYTITVRFGSSVVKTEFDAIFVSSAIPMPGPGPDEPRN